MTKRLKKGNLRCQEIIRMPKKEKLNKNYLEVQMKTGILDTIAKSIYSDPKVKIREAVANSMDNKATWFIIFADRPSRNITLIDNGTGISRKRFHEIFDNIGFGMQRNIYSNSYFGLGLLSILAFGQSAKIISRATSEKQVVKLEINSQEIFSEGMRDKPISNVGKLLTLRDSSISDRERISILSDSELKKVIGDFPETFTEIILENIDQTIFEQVISEDFIKELRKLLPLKIQDNEPFFASIKDNKASQWLADTMNNNDFCPTMLVYFAISGGEKELTPLWKYFPNFREKDLEIGAADIVYGKSNNNLNDGKPRFMYYYLYSTDDLEERSKINTETGFWVRNKNFLIKEADYFQKPGGKGIIHEPLKNWLFGEILHRDMTKFLIVTRNEYVWESDDFQDFRKEISSLVLDLNKQLRSVWKSGKEVVDSVINPFIEIAAASNPFSRSYDTLQKIGIIKKPNEVDNILDKLSDRRIAGLEKDEIRIDNKIKQLRQDIVLADDDNMKVIIDQKIGPQTKYTKQREEGTNRIIVKISPDIFAPVKVLFLGKTFDVFYVDAKESSPGISINHSNYKIYINPFNQDISQYSLSFIEVYIALELADICSKTKEEMKKYLLDLLGAKLIAPEINPKKYLFSLKDELQRRRSA